MHDKEIGALSVRAQRAAGIAHVPEIAPRSAPPRTPAAANLAVGFQRQLAQRGFLRPRAIRAHAAAIVARFEVRTAGLS